jgi:hypothetical protein
MKPCAARKVLEQTFLDSFRPRIQSRDCDHDDPAPRILVQQADHEGAREASRPPAAPSFTGYFSGSRRT